MTPKEGGTKKSAVLAKVLILSFFKKVVLRPVYVPSSWSLYALGLFCPDEVSGNVRSYAPTTGTVFRCTLQ
jgi:hypothetical protein